MAPVRIYVTRTCGFCFAAKRLLDDKGVAYEEIDVTGDSSTRAWLREVTGHRTVPQVFIGDRPYGGFTDIAALDQRGELDRLLADER
jgi:glutaredoxin 3